MKHLNCIFIGLTFLFAGLISASAQVSEVEAREALLVKAERLKAATAGSILSDYFASIPDPFNLPEDQTKTVSETKPEDEKPPPVVLSDQEVLLEISERVQPTGVMHFGEDTLLLFGERRVRVGDFLSVQHLGRTYKIQLVKAEARAFMLRLNDEFISKRIQ